VAHELFYDLPAPHGNAEHSTELLDAIFDNQQNLCNGGLSTPAQPLDWQE
jgi:hypothetical protein